MDSDVHDLLAHRAVRLRAVFLDAGNTLIHPDWALIAAWCREAGASLTPEELVRAEYHGRLALDALRAGVAQAPSEGYFGTVLEAAGVRTEVREQVLMRLREREQEGTLWLAVRPGTAEALQRLRHLGLRLGVVSNADGRVEQFLVRAGLRPLLDFVVDSGLVGVEKPDPGIFRIALARAGVGPDEVIHVGDLCSTDAAGAAAAGLPAIILDPLDRYHTCRAPRVRGLPELAELLERYRAGEPDGTDGPENDPPSGGVRDPRRNQF